MDEFLVFTRMSKATCTTLSLGKNTYLHDFSLFAFGDDHLRDAVTANNERHIGEIDEDDTDLTTIVGVNGARRIQYSDAALECQTTARTHLSFIAYRDFHI